MNGEVCDLDGDGCANCEVNLEVPEFQRQTWHGVVKMTMETVIRNGLESYLGSPPSWYASADSMPETRAAKACLHHQLELAGLALSADEADTDPDSY